MVKFNYSSGIPYKGKERFEIFLIIMKIFVVRNKKYLHRFHTLYSMRVSPYKMIDQSICYKKNKSLFFWRHKT